MQATSSPALIEVDALRVGMFIHLDVGWMAHPFPLSNFKISSPQQVETLRSLGLKAVRWNREEGARAPPGPGGAGAGPADREAFAPADAREEGAGDAMADDAAVVGAAIDAASAVAAIQRNA